TGSKGLESSLEKSTYKYALVAWLEEMARMVKSFKFSAGSQLHIRRADEKTLRYLGARTRHFTILLLQYRSLVAFKVIITAAMLIVGVILLLNQQMNIGQFVAAEIIILTIINSIEKIIVNLDSVYEVLTSVEKISKVTDKPVEYSGTYRLAEEEGIRITAEGLGFAYPERAVLKNLSFDISSGQKVGITGHDGSGKSTLLKILTGIYGGLEGSLLLNEVPIGNYNLESLRQKTGIFFLYENIFNGTLQENLTMGRQVNQPYLHSLVMQTGLTDFLKTLPQGYDTELDPTGKRLPMNVVQKILLVRALAHQPRLLLLEEPWRGLEEPSRHNIQQLLLTLPQATVMVATNDEAFLRQAQQVIRL
ncbi:MAG TPA: ATP-binding cassette domain-containing protein, partial [Flavisolibacter sp.]|nr:ATP-binding cassette domain-containing protein [Flavisolibacter sp.]